MTHSGSTVVMIASDQAACGLIELGDELRAGTLEVVNELKARGVGLSMYSGDGEKSVQRIANRLGISDYAANLRPQDKLDRVRRLTASGLKTAMVGDGINDAPVLAGATVSIAMGAGAHTARASADFILINDQLSALPKALRIAHRSRRIMRQNIAWALAYNMLALPVAAAGWIAPWMAAVGMSLSALLVVGNSLRLAPRASQTNQLRKRPAPSLVGGPV
jgi:Cu2+-exporting ATPase